MEASNEAERNDEATKAAIRKSRQWLRWPARVTTRPCFPGSQSEKGGSCSLQGLRVLGKKEAGQLAPQRDQPL